VKAEQGLICPPVRPRGPERPMRITNLSLVTYARTDVVGSLSPADSSREATGRSRVRRVRGSPTGPSAGRADPMTPSRTSRRRPEVLLVEDSVETRRALRELLEAQGILIVGEAADGATGIELAKVLKPDVVLMDVKMPRMGGIEATEIITSSLSDTRVIVLTTFDDASVRRQADEAGATAYLVKGGSPDAIADAIFRALGP